MEKTLFWERIFDRMFFRTWFSIFGFRSPLYQRQWDFEPYFQYKLGQYRLDFCLYFREKPHLTQYKGEIVHKLLEYDGYDITRYLGHHYDRYPDKKEFLRFLRYEAGSWLKGASSSKKDYYGFRNKLEITLQWIAEQEETLPSPAATSPIPDAARPDTATTPANPIPAAYTTPAQDPPIQQLQHAAESGMQDITRSFAGEIAMNNEYQLDRVIKLFILLQEMYAPGNGKEIHYLFKSFSDTDLAAILRQFEKFSDKKLNTIQKKIAEYKEELHQDPQGEKLRKALITYFYKRS
jgi:hypothetical protein